MDSSLEKISDAPDLPASVWQCRIGPASRLPKGSDAPMRRAVERAFRELAGDDAAACFSGWGEQFTEAEIAAIENREPDPDIVQIERVAEIKNLIRALPRRGVFPSNLEAWAHDEDHYVAHPDDRAVDQFAARMRAKLAQARLDGNGGWDDPEQCSVEKLAKRLLHHVATGDPVDIANFCMMLSLRGVQGNGGPISRQYHKRESDVVELSREERIREVETNERERIARRLRETGEEINDDWGWCSAIADAIDCDFSQLNKPPARSLTDEGEGKDQS